MLDGILGETHYLGHLFQWYLADDISHQLPFVVFKPLNASIEVFHEAVVTGCVASLAGRLEIAREWEWTVSGSGENAVGRFRTEDRALLRVAWVHRLRGSFGKGIPARKMRSP